MKLHFGKRKYQLLLCSSNLCQHAVLVFTAYPLCIAG